MEQLSALDESFLHLETEYSQMHIGSVAIFEGPPPPYDDLKAMVDSKLGLVPRYRQKVRFVPGDLGRPVWVDDPHLNLEYHVRHTSLPAPGSEEQLRNLAARLFSQQLDRSKPLWEMWLVEGLADGRELSPLQAAFLEHGGVQCGFCTPGMLVSATALVRANPGPTEDEVRIALSGNLCRCTGYDGIVKAVLSVAESAR